MAAPISHPPAHKWQSDPFALPHSARSALECPECVRGFVRGRYRAIHHRRASVIHHIPTVEDRPHRVGPLTRGSGRAAVVVWRVGATRAVDLDGDGVSDVWAVHYGAAKLASALEFKELGRHGCMPARLRRAGQAGSAGIDIPRSAADGVMGSTPDSALSPPPTRPPALAHGAFLATRCHAPSEDTPRPQTQLGSAGPRARAAMTVNCASRVWN